VTQLHAAVLWVAAFQLTATIASTYMFSLEIIARTARCRIQRSRFSPIRLTLGSFTLTSAASLTTLVTSAIQRNSADTHTLRRLLSALVANGGGSGAVTSTGYIHSLETRRALSLMAELLTEVPTIQFLVTWLGTVRYRVLAGRSVGICHLIKESLTTGAGGYNIRRSRAMCWFGNLSVARLLATMLPTIEKSTADVGAFKCADPLLNGSSVIGRCMCLSALLLLCSVTAKYVFLNLTAVASGRDTHFAGPALAIMTWS
jgi:hypothetical protein